MMRSKVLHHTCYKSQKHKILNQILDIIKIAIIIYMLYIIARISYYLYIGMVGKIPVSKTPFAVDYGSHYYKAWLAMNGTAYSPHWFGGKNLFWVAPSYFALFLLESIFTKDVAVAFPLTYIATFIILGVISLTTLSFSFLLPIVGFGGPSIISLGRVPSIMAHLFGMSAVYLLLRRGEKHKIVRIFAAIMSAIAVGFEPTVGALYEFVVVALLIELAIKGKKDSIFLIAIPIVWTSIQYVAIHITLPPIPGLHRIGINSQIRTIYDILRSPLTPVRIYVLISVPLFLAAIYAAIKIKHLILSTTLSILFLYFAGLWVIAPRWFPLNLIYPSTYFIFLQFVSILIIEEFIRASKHKICATIATILLIIYVAGTIAYASNATVSSAKLVALKYHNANVAVQLDECARYLKGYEVYTIYPWKAPDRIACDFDKGIPQYLNIKYNIVTPQGWIQEFIPPEISEKWWQICAILSEFNSTKLHRYLRDNNIALILHENKDVNWTCEQINPTIKCGEFCVVMPE